MQARSTEELQVKYTLGTCLKIEQVNYVELKHVFCKLSGT
jgi:hypothetical protein